MPTFGVIFHPKFPPETLADYARRAEAAGFDELNSIPKIRQKLRVVFLSILSFPGRLFDQQILFLYEE